ncbi:MAG: hypothetical protein RPS47_12570 [Colwellia sp.]|jgi:hypothetical protein
MRIKFNETESFFKKLDAGVENGNVLIYFGKNKPGEKSKIWPRLRKCNNWSNFEKEFKKIEKGKSSPLGKVMSVSMTNSITGGELVVIAWIATLIASIFMYAIYKNRDVKFKIKKGKGGEPDEVEIEVKEGKEDSESSKLLNLNKNSLFSTRSTF